eukprot:contig_15547_g3713
MVAWPDARAFTRPVSELWAPEDLPDYDVYVSRRMDLGTVAAYVDSGLYGANPGGVFDSAAFAADVRLTFTNAMAYSPADSAFYAHAAALLGRFEARWCALPKETEVASSVAPLAGRSAAAGGATPAGAGAAGGAKAPAKKKSKKKKPTAGGAAATGGAVAATGAVPPLPNAGVAGAGETGAPVVPPKKKSHKKKKPPVDSGPSMKGVPLQKTTPAARGTVSHKKGAGSKKKGAAAAAAAAALASAGATTPTPAGAAMPALAGVVHEAAAVGAWHGDAAVGDTPQGVGVPPWSSPAGTSPSVAERSTPQAGSKKAAAAVAASARKAAAAEARRAASEAKAAALEERKAAQAAAAEEKRAAAAAAAEEKRAAAEERRLAAEAKKASAAAARAALPKSTAGQ